MTEDTETPPPPLLFLTRNQIPVNTQSPALYSDPSYQGGRGRHRDTEGERHTEGKRRERTQPAQVQQTPTRSARPSTQSLKDFYFDAATTVVNELTGSERERKRASMC